MILPVLCVTLKTHRVVQLKLIVKHWVQSGVVQLMEHFIVVKPVLYVMKASFTIALTKPLATVQVASGVALIVLPSARAALKTILGVAKHRVIVSPQVVNGVEAEQKAGALTLAASVLQIIFQRVQITHNVLKIMASGVSIL